MQIVNQDRLQRVGIVISAALINGVLLLGFLVMRSNLEHSNVAENLLGVVSKGSLICGFCAHIIASVASVRAKGLIQLVVCLVLTTAWNQTWLCLLVISSMPFKL